MDNEIIDNLQSFIKNVYGYENKCSYIVQDENHYIEIKINNFVHNKMNEQTIDKMKRGIKLYIQNKYNDKEICIVDSQYWLFDGISKTDTNKSEKCIYLHL